MKLYKSVHSLALCAIPVMLAGLCPPAATAATTIKLPVVDPFYASYPADCSGGPVATGLCLLASTAPLATGDFRVSQPPGGGDGIPVLLNTRLPLSPGNYVLYRAGELDYGHTLKFTVTEGKITTLKTATLKLQDSPGQYNKVQHFQAISGINGAGCKAEVGAKGIKAYLPGNYTASTVSTLTTATPVCARNGIAFNLMAGQAATVRPYSATEQTLPATNTYRHPAKGVSLTNIDHLRHDIDRAGLLPGWRSLNGVHNPGSAKLDALVLSGAPNYDFLVPVKIDPSNPTYCGTSVASGGIPPRNLLINCVFDGTGRLTQFQVQAGQYYSFDNIHGQSGVAGHVINSPFIVRRVQFNLKGN
ncbi:MAG: hypothetical protein ACKN9T_08625 [Candidatus Methylumidiphilus sp.]